MRLSPEVNRRRYTCTFGVSPNRIYTLTRKQNTMTIQVNTDKNIEGSENMEVYFTEKIESGLKHFADKITRAEVHLSDQNADRNGTDDIQCRIEVRVEGQQPVMAESKADTHEKALSGAVDKMQAILRKIIGKMQEKHN
jgi:ribosomal subunit interface protein